MTALQTLAYPGLLVALLVALGISLGLALNGWARRREWRRRYGMWRQQR